MNVDECGTIFLDLPYQFIRGEMDARGWSNGDLVCYAHLPCDQIDGIVAGRIPLSPAACVGIGRAFQTGGLFWLKLQQQVLPLVCDWTPSNSGRRFATSDDEFNAFVIGQGSLWYWSVNGRRIVWADSGISENAEQAMQAVEISMLRKQ